MKDNKAAAQAAWNEVVSKLGPRLDSCLCSTHVQTFEGKEFTPIEFTDIGALCACSMVPVYKSEWERLGVYASAYKSPGLFYEKDGALWVAQDDSSNIFHWKITEKCSGITAEILKQIAARPRQTFAGVWQTYRYLLFAMLKSIPDPGSVTRFDRFFSPWGVIHLVYS